MARVTTHVLDTARGTPGADIKIDFFVVGGERRLIGSAVTDRDGRADLGGQSGVSPGVYELVFHAGDYFRRRGIAIADPPFLDVIPIRFGLADPQAHYHVPLIVSPWSYSTYRGS